MPLMSDPDIQVMQVDWQQHLAPLRSIREQVFIQEQGVSVEEEWDSEDENPETRHYLLTLDQQPAACARMQANGQLGRMAVLADYRGRGIGRVLLQQVIADWLDAQFEQPEPTGVFLHAQTQAIPFYESLGFAAEGDVFMDAGIPHRQMTPAEAPVFYPCLYRDRVNRLETPAGFRQHLCQMAAASSRALDILCHHLDKTLWGQESVVSAISALARRNANSRVRILLMDSRPLSGSHHPLVQLAQRLSSRLECRVLNDETLAVDHAYAMADRRHLLYFNSEEDCVGFANYEARAECRNRLEQFAHLWEHNSDPDPNLQRLFI